MNYPAIRIEGAILSPDLLDRLEDAPGQRPADFGLDASAKVKEEIVRAWADAQDYWRIFQRKLSALKTDAPATTETRNLWITPLLALLGYQLEYQARSGEVNGKSYPISHRVTNGGQTPLHIIGYQEPAGLDRKPERASGGATNRISAHGLVQEYLNLTDQLYGLVTNGRVLRLLRDSSRLVKLTYLEFDLDRIFTDGLFADFALLFRLLHASRLPTTAETAATSLIERYHQDSLDSGARIRAGLSRAVEQAIRAFAQGFLAHAANTALHEAVRAGQLPPAAYYQHLLRLIYRLLFLFVIEERNLVYPPAGKDPVALAQQNIYDRYYSLQRLRRLAEKRYLADARHDDLWLALLASFRLFEADGPGVKLGLAPLAGDLFNPDAIGLLNECMLGNDVLLACLRSLSLYQHPVNGQLIRVNYAALNVEELGSVYEGLLKFEPAFDLTTAKPTFTLNLGADDTQSHYTADDLVQPLLKHSLDYLIVDCLEQAREVGSREIGKREVGSRGIAKKGKNNDVDQFVSRSHGLAEGDATGRALLPADAPLSEGGVVRTDLTDSAGRGVDPGEYRGGVGTRGDPGIHPVPPHRPGQSEGTGNPSDPQSAGGTGQGNRNRPATYPMQRDRTDDALPDWFFTAQAEWQRQNSVTSRPSSPTSLPPYSLLAEHALLSLRVADISCGSGHILLAAARRIAAALATVRTGEEQPSPAVFRAAVRDVIRTCIYGVDLNPLAVELCKVALWLEAHNPGAPLNFLDHHIKCGNAIVGFVHREELEHGVPDEAFATLPTDDKAIAATFRKRNKEERSQPAQQQFNLTAHRQQQFAEMLRRWRDLAALPERTGAEIAAKKQRFQDFAQSQDAWLLTQIAAIPIAQFYLPKTAAERATLTTDAEFRAYWSGQQTPQGQATAAAWALALRKRFFHWFLEFPEIMARGGFDCILGNPPYLGGQAMSSTYGYPFCHYAKWAYSPTGLSDLVTYFVRRIYSLLRPSGFTAFITTNSIKDGDVRKDGLDQVVAQGGTINFAVRGIRWPGRASLVVSLVSIYKGSWENRPHVLDGENVSFISTRFEDSVDVGEPLPLNENQRRLFVGVIYLGDGFLLTNQQAEEMTRADARLKEVIQPVINGQELINTPDQCSGRQIINFFNWSFEKAATYGAAFERVKTLVKPERDKVSRPARRERWWQYAEQAKGLYTSIQNLTHCFVVAQTGKHHAFFVTPTSQVFLQTCYIFASDQWSEYAVLQSTVHYVWVLKYSGSIKRDPRYLPTQCFLNFPFPHNESYASRAAEIGKNYHEFRGNLMRQLWLGLTDLYNLFHSRDLTPALVAKTSKQPPAVAAAGYQAILELRAFHRQLDQTVLAAYGWASPSTGSGNAAPEPVEGNALDLGHDFYEIETLPENDRVRYTISPVARKEVLRRLLALNHARAAAEAAVESEKPKKKRGKRGEPADAPQLDLFG